MTAIYEFCKAFAGPIATALAAVAATAVTFKLGSNQVAIAREQAQFAAANSRATQQKLVLDLFDKRFAIVTELREAVGEFIRTAAISYETALTFHRAADRAKLLFGPEVSAYLETIRKALSKHRAAEVYKDSQNEVQRGRAADTQLKQFEIIQTFYTSFDGLIAPYMTMHDKVPT
jgi:hypothetical protein